MCQHIGTPDAGITRHIDEMTVLTMFTGVKQKQISAFWKRTTKNNGDKLNQAKVLELKSTEPGSSNVMRAGDRHSGGSIKKESEGWRTQMQE